MESRFKRFCCIPSADVRIMGVTHDNRSPIIRDEKPNESIALNFNNLYHRGIYGGSQGGTRTHKPLILSERGMPIPVTWPYFTTTPGMAEGKGIEPLRLLTEIQTLSRRSPTPALGWPFRILIYGTPGRSRTYRLSLIRRRPCRWTTGAKRGAIKLPGYSLETQTGLQKPSM